MVVIIDTLAGWTDKASAAEDDLPDEDYIHGLGCRYGVESYEETFE